MSVHFFPTHVKAKITDSSSERAKQIERGNCGMKQIFIFLVMVALMVAVVFFAITNLEADDAKHGDDHGGDKAEIAVPDTQKVHPFTEQCYKCHANEVAYKEWTSSVL